MPDLNLEEYQVISAETVAITKILSTMWERLGKPTTPLSPQGEKLMKILVASWEDLFPKEAKEWAAVRKDYKATEKSIHEQSKGHTGRSLASYPMYIYKIMKVLFPNFDPAERKNCMKVVKKWPMFQMCQKV